MITLGYISAVIAGIALFGVSAWSHLEAYKRGYVRGRRDADGWWMGMEEEADRERVKIWREET